jgi:hypothetical protein
MCHLLCVLSVCTQSYKFLCVWSVCVCMCMCAHACICECLCCLLVLGTSHNYAHVSNTVVLTPHFTLKLPTPRYERPPFLTLSLCRVVIILVEVYQCICSIKLVVMIIKEIMWKSWCRYYVSLHPLHIKAEFSVFRSRENPISPVNNNEETEEWIYQWNQVLDITMNCYISFSFLSSSLCAWTILAQSLGLYNLRSVQLTWNCGLTYFFFSVAKCNETLQQGF